MSINSSRNFFSIMEFTWNFWAEVVSWTDQEVLGELSCFLDFILSDS